MTRGQTLVNPAPVKAALWQASVWRARSGAVGSIVVPASSARAPPGGGDFGANHICQLGFVRRVQLADFRESCSAGGTGLIIDLCRFPGAAFGAIQMYLGKPGLNIGTHHVARMCHSGFSVLCPPHLWPQMVAAKMDQITIDIVLAGETKNEFDVIGGGHSGVAAKLVNLIAGGFDQDMLLL